MWHDTTTDRIFPIVFSWDYTQEWEVKKHDWQDHVILSHVKSSNDLSIERLDSSNVTENRSSHNDSWSEINKDKKKVKN